MTQQQRNLFVLVLLALGVLGGLAILSSNRPATPTQTTTPAAEEIQTVTYTDDSGNQQFVALRRVETDVLEGARFVFGASDAKNTIVEFADYQCPACGLFVSRTWEALDKEFIQTGQARFAFRDFPLPQHQNAKLAAQAAACVQAQNRYEPFKKLLFGQQAAWSASLETEAKKQFTAFARQVGVSSQDFAQCLEAGASAAAIEQDLALAYRVGLTSTPSFVVNGYLFAGALPIQAFRAILQKVGR
jgi:protein-disulfide isomerase